MKHEKYSDTWETPEKEFEELLELFGPFDLDAAADVSNAKAGYFITRETDALSLPNWATHPWGPGNPLKSKDHIRIFLNPPLSQEAGPLIRWVRHAYLQAVNYGHFVLAILPATPNTDWYHRYIVGKAARWTPRARIKFTPGTRPEFFVDKDGKPKTPGSGRHDSMVVVWAGRLGLRGFWS